MQRVVSCPNCNFQANLARKCSRCGEEHPLEPGAVLFCPACWCPMVVDQDDGEIRRMLVADIEAMSAAEVMDLFLIKGRMQHTTIN